MHYVCTKVTIYCTLYVDRIATPEIFVIKNVRKIISVSGDLQQPYKQGTSRHNVDTGKIYQYWILREMTLPIRKDIVGIKIIQ